MEKQEETYEIVARALANAFFRELGPDRKMANFLQEAPPHIRVRVWEIVEEVRGKWPAPYRMEIR